MSASERPGSLTPLARLGFSRLTDAEALLSELSELVAETLGEQVFNYVLLNKRREWQEYRSQVTAFELKSNLEML